MSPSSLVSWHLPPPLERFTSSGGVSVPTPPLRMAGGEMRRDEESPPSSAPSKDLLGVSGLLSNEFEG